MRKIIFLLLLGFFAHSIGFVQGLPPLPPSPGGSFPPSPGGSGKLAGGSLNSMEPPGEGEGGGDTNEYVFLYSAPPGLKFTNTVQNIPWQGAEWLSFDLIETVPGAPYDIYRRTNVAGYLGWNRIARGTPGQTHFDLDVFAFDKPFFLMAGAGWDSDGDGLEDGFEALVSGTDWTKFDTDGDGYGDGWEWLRGMDPTSGLDGMDTDHDGLPDGWETAASLTSKDQPDTGSTGLPDAVRDTDGDGWVNIEELRRGTAARSYELPPTISTRRIDLPAYNSARLEWSGGMGTVTGYSVERHTASGSTTLATLSASARDYTVANWYPSNALAGENLTVTPVMAGGGAPSSSATSSLDWFYARALRGPQGRTHLFAAALPAEAVALRVTADQPGFTYGWNFLPVDPLGYLLSYTNIVPPARQFDLPLSRFTNGLCLILDTELPPHGNYRLRLQAVRTDGAAGAPQQLDTAAGNLSPRAPFFDGTELMLANARFLLQGGGDGFVGEDNAVFSVGLNPYAIGNGTFVVDRLIPGRAPSVVSDLLGPANYIRSDLRFNSWAPWQLNRMLKNFEFDALLLRADGTLNTGGDPDYPWPLAGASGHGHRVLLPSAAHVFDVEGTASAQSTNLPGDILQSPASRWIISSIWNMGWGPDPAAPPGYFRPAQATSVHGLSLQSVLHTSTNGTTQTFVPGVDYPDSQAPGVGWWYFRFAPPVLRTETNHWASDYRLRYPDFWSPTPPPDDTSFDPLATPPLLFASVDDPGERFYGWARMAVANGADTNVHAYVARYFDTAYRASVTNGQVLATTNRTGVLSEYGDFYATEPGPVVLTTRALVDDTGTTNIGQLVVHSLALLLDSNHDGAMGTNVAYADWTTPFRHWVNDDADDGWVDTEPIESGRDAKPDAQTQNLQTIGSTRDLEDFARLWISGVPTLPANQGYSVNLEWEGDHYWETAPTLNFFLSADTDGSANYLINTNAAVSQLVSYLTIPGTGNWPHPNYPGSTRISCGMVGPNSSLSLPITLFGNKRHLCLVFEGLKAGSGTLQLVVRKDGKIVGITSRRIEIQDVKDMYERAHITGVDANPLHTDVSGFVPSFIPQARVEESDEVIALVHGWNMSQGEYHNFSETMFKRLWWQGYRGRFAGVRWPTYSADNAGILSRLTYNSSELVAWRSGLGVAQFMTSLRQRFPTATIGVCAHSMGNVAMAQALKHHLSQNVQEIDNYVLMQAAVPAGSYDVAAPNWPALANSFATSPAPDDYIVIATNISQSVRRRVVNFHNTNDFALATGTLGGIEVNWLGNQRLNKPDGLFSPPTAGKLWNYSWTASTNPPYASAVDLYGNNPRIVTNNYESLAFVSRSHTRAVGSIGGIGGALNVSEEVDLNRSVESSGVLGLNREQNEHSGQFNWHCQKTWLFYKKLTEVILYKGLNP